MDNQKTSSTTQLIYLQSHRQDARFEYVQMARGCRRLVVGSDICCVRGVRRGLDDLDRYTKRYYQVTRGKRVHRH